MSLPHYIGKAPDIILSMALPPHELVEVRRYLYPSNPLELRFYTVPIWLDILCMYTSNRVYEM